MEGGIMMEMFQDTIIQGDCLTELKKAPSDFVDCCFTSSPYWGLRDYGLQNVKVWGGNPECEHEWQSREYALHNGRGDAQKGAKFSDQEPIPDIPLSDGTCVKCGAWKGQLGLEPHPQMFIDHIVEIFHEVQRVLKPTGCLFLNLGDTYFGGGRGQKFAEGYKQASNKDSSSYASIPPVKSDGSNWLRPKQKLLIPERIAIAMQDDGWLLRNSIVWHKINHMPESVTDRLTRSYETVFFFTKSSKYYFNLDKIRKPYPKATIDRCKRAFQSNNKTYAANFDTSKHVTWAKKITKHDLATNRIGNFSYSDPLHTKAYNPVGANPGDVWSLTQEGYKEAHFATFPTKLVYRGLSCGCPPDGLVLDPFSGSGTTLYVARKMALHYIGIELNPEYIKLAKKRLDKIPSRLDLFVEPLATALNGGKQSR